MIKYLQDKIGIKGNSLTLIKDLNPKYTENTTLNGEDQTLECLLSLFVGILANAYVRFSIIIITATIIRICEKPMGSDKTANIAHWMLILEECQ